MPPLSRLSPKKELFNKYEEFLERVSDKSQALSSLHSSSMKCMAGCSSCCRHLSLLPIEWYYIDSKISGIKSSLELQSNEACPFLVNQLCRIYEFRPLICRTHGLPLLYLNDDFNWELSYCPLNFSSVKEKDFEAYFSFDSCLNMEELNKELSRLNGIFIKEKAGENLSPAIRLPMNSLLS